ncbi:hypothetical protein EG346_19830 [Chryseobacterium carnipullorum]|uniref:Uncharacterized protein n=1 Tax=Chryseobacterium carnipullorum TaxID=1124835 RepID=A0A376DYN0_CHRCU|nr:hypothetical protein [Chryseobacterium carnipullorum]AZA50285.1 hypothetical protein EG346_19830 [Chryseobacterium carnipullorum]AZA65158.1 hypothetical protein EG345_10875 [Chryseobacterium carnipullorum]STC98277.1 Uncharacterised protein [Chryseobacterium carnipullorum]
MRKILLAGILTLGGFVTASAQCTSVTTITENFDSWKDISKCWTAQQGKAMLYANDKRIIFYSMSSPGENMYLITPKIKAGTYTLSFDISDNGGETTLEMFSINNPSDSKSYVSIANPSKITGDKKTFDIYLKKDSSLGLKVLLNGVHQAVYVDNFSLKQKK